MTGASTPTFTRAAALTLLALSISSCGGGDITFGGGNDNTKAKVTFKGNLDSVSPVTSRDIVVFVYNIDKDDESDRCPCPQNPSNSTNGKAAVLASGETEFTISGLTPGRFGVVLLLDNAGNLADGEIDPGDPIAILDDVDCQLDDVKGDLTVTLDDIDVSFSDAPVDNPNPPVNPNPPPATLEPTTFCKESDPPNQGRARAFLVTLKKTTAAS